jgi:hypothetical protein
MAVTLVFVFLVRFLPDHQKRVFTEAYAKFTLFSDKSVSINLTFDYIQRRGLEQGL